MDPDGEEIKLATDKASQKLRKSLVAALRKPSFRKTFSRLASSKDFSVTVKAGTLTPAANVMAIRKGAAKNVSLNSGRIANPSVKNGKIESVEMIVDRNAVSVHQVDTSGVATFAHEANHAEAIMDATANGDAYDVAWAAGVAGDSPTSATGPSVAVGAAVAAEKDDISKADAEKFLNANLSP